jgi:hypothetical protein
MRKDQIFPSKYLKEPDLRGRETTVTIDHAEQVVLNGKPSLLVHFEGKDKALVVNATIFDQIERSTGEDDADNWAGHKITLYPTETTFQGKVMPVVRVKTTKPGATNGGSKKPASPPQGSAGDFPEEEDEVDNW